MIYVCSDNKKNITDIKKCFGHGIPCLLYGHVFKGVFKLYLTVIAFGAQLNKFDFIRTKITVRIFSCVDNQICSKGRLATVQKP